MSEVKLALSILINWCVEMLPYALLVVVGAMIYMVAVRIFTNDPAVWRKMFDRMGGKLNE